jgi:hypothetical protein
MWSIVNLSYNTEDEEEDAGCGMQEYREHLKKTITDHILLVFMFILKGQFHEIWEFFY